MKQFLRLTTVCLLTPLFMACSKGPSESEVETLIQAQFEQPQSIMGDAMASAGDDESSKALGAMLTNMIPKLESVDDINCDAVEGDNTYLCTAAVNQTLAGNSRTDKATFKVYKVNDEWVLYQ